MSAHHIYDRLSLLNVDRIHFTGTKPQATTTTKPEKRMKCGKSKKIWNTLRRSLGDRAIAIAHKISGLSNGTLKSCIRWAYWEINNKLYVFN